MSFTRTRVAGFWTIGTTILGSELEHLDDYSYAIDSRGGTYAPAALITIGGSGLTVSGEFIASDAFTIDVNGSLTINSGAQLNLNDNMVVGSGAIAGFTSGSFLTVQSGATFTANSGSTVNIAATTTLSGATTISGTLSCSNTITIASANNIALSPPRSYTRTCGPAVRYDAAKWQPPTALAAAPVTLAQAAAITPGAYAEMVEYRADVPQSSTLFSITVRVKGSAALAGLPATLPTVRVIRTDTTTGAAIVLATATDATAALADYKLDHDIVVSVAVSVDRARYEYLVYVEGDSGSGGTFGTEVSSPRMVFIRGIIGEG
jgi:hypothetical protein